MKGLLHFRNRVCLLGMLIWSWTQVQAQTAVEAWVRRYNSSEAGSGDYARKVVTDPDGNIVVAGESDDRIVGRDILIIKYSGTGVPVWTNRYNGAVNIDDDISDLAVDTHGNVFVTGSSGSPRYYATLAYSAAGMPLWTNYYNGPANTGDVPSAVALDHNGNVFVTGYSSNNGGKRDYATIAYSGAGVALWTNRYGPGGFLDGASAVAVDHSGNVFVTGSLGGDYATIAYSGTGVPLWTSRYNGPGNPQDSGIAIAADNVGNVFVTGSSYINGASYNRQYATIAYSPAGVALWTNHYNGPGNSEDFATALAVDQNGNVFVTGSSYNIVSFDGDNFYYATIAYSGAGAALWTNLYAGPGYAFDRPNSLAVDNNGNVLVAGSSDHDYVTIKYSSAGVALWTNRYDGPPGSDDGANDVSVDNSGNIFVTGPSRADYVTIAYSSAGVAVWTNRYNGPGNSDDDASAIAVDDSTGNVLVTGHSPTGDYVTVAYSEAGVPLWTNHYNGSASDQAGGPRAIAVGNNGNVFVTGSSRGADSPDYATIAYSASGVPLWTNRYNGPRNSFESARAIAVNGSGNVFVTGYSYGIESDYDYATIAYTGAGMALWTNRYNGPGNSTDYADAMAVDNAGNVFVTGWSDGTDSYVDYATIAYSASGVALWTNRYTGPAGSFDRAKAVAVDHHGHIFVTGYSSGNGGDLDYATVAYSGKGVALWTNRYNGPANGDDGANAIVVDHTGNVFVTGYSSSVGSALDYATIAYSGAGVALWTNRYNGIGHTNDQANAVTVDRSGNVFVTGHSIGNGSSFDYATVAYSAVGVALWTNRYNGPANGPDQPALSSCLAIGRDGAVYVTGSSDGHHGDHSISDYLTIKYVWRAYLAIQPFTVSSSAVNLTLSGPADSSWYIQRAPLISGPWTNLGLSLIGTNGFEIFRDANPLNGGAFYRVTPP